MAEPTTAAYTTTGVTSLVANRVNQKVFTVNGTHTAIITTLTVVETIADVTAPLYLLNGRTNEIVYAEGISGKTFTSCTRGATGSTNAIMTSGDRLYHCLTANDLSQIVRELIAVAVDAKDGANTERIALQSYIQSEIKRFLPYKVQFDQSTTFFLNGDKTFALPRTDIPATDSTTYNYLRGDGTWAIPPTATVTGSEADIILYNRMFR